MTVDESQHTGPANPRPAGPSIGRLARAGTVAGVVAAAATTGAAAAARAADVSLEVDAQAIPLGAFAWWTVVGAALGVLIARLAGERSRFIAIAAVATALSLIPAVVAPDDTATIVVLVGCHLLAAVIVVPVLGRRLHTRDAMAAHTP